MTEYTEQEVRVAKALLGSEHSIDTRTTLSETQLEQRWNWLTDGHRSRFLRYARIAITEIREEADR